MRRSIILAALLAGSLGAAPDGARADGGYLTMPPYRLEEPDQKALLAYDAAAGRETLVIQPGFRGDARAFAWVVPVPSTPDIAVADDGTFWSLESLTAPLYRSRDGDWDCLESPRQDFIAAPGIVVSRQLVGYYDALTVAADDAQALYDSLTVWGFLHDGNEDAATAALGPYVDEGWSFVAVRVDTTALAAMEPWYDNYIYALDPLRLEFAAAAPVYPMRISALSAAPVSEVDLYVAADHRMTFPAGETWYARRIGEAEYGQLRGNPDLAELVPPGAFLTRLHRGWRAADMTEDVYPVRAPDDDEFRLVHYAGLPLTGLLLFGPPAGWFAWRLRRRTRRRAKPAGASARG